MYKILNNILEMDDYSLQRLSKPSKLPSEYQQIEYIESTGTQYIDTGYIPDNTNGYKIECEVCPTALGSRYAILSGYNTNNSLSLEITNQNKARAYFYYGSSLALDKFFGTITSNKNTIIIEYLNGRFTRTVNGETSSETINLLGTANESMYMFVDRQLRYSTFYKPLKMYKCKLYNNNYLIRDFVPCYRKSDNEIGLYDIVNGVFYTNQGTGEFTYGSTSLALSTPVGVKGIEDRANDLSFTDFNNWESDQYDINENKDIEEIEQIKAPNILSDTYTSITADTEVQPSQVDFIPKAIEEIKANQPNAEQIVDNDEE